MDIHQLQSLKFEVKFYDPKAGFEFQQHFGNFVKKDLLHTVAQTLALFEKENTTTRISKVEVELGKIPFSSYQTQLPEKLKTQLLKQLKAALSEDLSLIPEKNQYQISQQADMLETFIFFLDNGFLPWWAQSAAESFFSVHLLFLEILEKQSEILKTKLTQKFRQTQTLLRFVRQLPDTALKTFFLHFAPKKAQTYWDELLTISAEKSVTPTFFSPEAAKIYLIEWLLFSHKNPQTLRSDFIAYLAQKSKIESSQLKTIFKLQTQKSAPPDNRKITQKNETETTFKPQNNKITPPDNRSFRQKNQGKLSSENKNIQFSENKKKPYEKIVESYLLTKSPKDDEQTFSEAWALFYRQKSLKLSDFYTKNWENKILQQKTMSFPDRRNTQLIRVIEPSYADYLINYARNVQKAEHKYNFLDAKKETIRKITWHFILQYLLTERGSVFNKKSFIWSFIHKTANYFSIEVEELVDKLQHAISKANQKIAGTHTLAILLSDFKATLARKKALHKETSLSFKNNVYTYQKADFLRFFFSHGKFKPTYGDVYKNNFKDFEQFLTHIIDNEPEFIEYILKDLSAQFSSEEIVKKITKKLDSRILFRIEKMIISCVGGKQKVDLSAEKKSNAKKPHTPSVQEITQDTFADYFFCLLSEDYLPKNLFFSTPSVFLATFHKKYPELLELLCRQIPRSGHKKLIAHLPKTMRPKFRRILQPSSAKYNWEQTAKPLKKALFLYLEKGQWTQKYSPEILDILLINYLQAMPESFKKHVKKGLKKPEVRKKWAKTHSETAFWACLHISPPAGLTSLTQQLERLEKTLKQLLSEKKYTADFKAIRQGFMLEISARQTGILDFKATTKLYLNYLKNSFSSFNAFLPGGFLEILQKMPASAHEKAALDVLEQELIIPPEKKSDDILSEHKKYESTKNIPTSKYFLDKTGTKTPHENLTSSPHKDQQETDQKIGTKEEAWKAELRQITEKIKYLKIEIRRLQIKCEQKKRVFTHQKKAANRFFSDLRKILTDREAQDLQNIFLLLRKNDALEFFLWKAAKQFETSPELLAAQLERLLNETPAAEIWRKKTGLSVADLSEKILENDFSVFSQKLDYQEFMIGFLQEKYPYIPDSELPDYLILGQLLITQKWAFFETENYLAYCTKILEKLNVSQKELKAANRRQILEKLNISQKKLKAGHRPHILKNTKEKSDFLSFEETERGEAENIFEQEKKSEQEAANIPKKENKYLPQDAEKNPKILNKFIISHIFQNLLTEKTLAVVLKRVNLSPGQVLGLWQEEGSGAVTGTGFWTVFQQEIFALLEKLTRQEKFRRQFWTEINQRAPASLAEINEKVIDNLDIILKKEWKIKENYFLEIQKILKEKSRLAAQYEAERQVLWAGNRQKKAEKQLKIPEENETKRHQFSPKKPNTSGKLFDLPSAAERPKNRIENEGEYSDILASFRKFDAHTDIDFYVDNAGLVLLHPYLRTLFERLGLLAERRFISLAASQKAVYVLQYLVTGVEYAPESGLVLNKFLCEIPLAFPLETDISLDDAEKQTCEEMLKAVIGHWSVLKNTSPAGLRGNFLLRGGKLSHDAQQGWQLHVASAPYDILLDRLPWTYSLFKLPWMSAFLNVVWR